MAVNSNYNRQDRLQNGSTSASSAAGTGSGGAATSNQMLQMILDRQPFQYDAKTDSAAQAARKAAARNARAVTRDTLGQHAGMTGGMPSTAAVSAAAQAGNAAMAQGADRVTELEQLAYQKYLQEGQNMANMHSMLLNQEQDAYQRQWNEQQWAYQKEQDAYQRSWNEDQRDYDREQDEYEKKLAMAQLAAAYGDYSGLKALGVDTSKYMAGGSSGGGYRYKAGGSRGGGGGGGPDDTGKKPAGGLPQRAKNELKVIAADNGGYIPNAQWASYAAQYGEAALIAAGFKKSPYNGSGGLGGGLDRVAAKAMG